MRKAQHKTQNGTNTLFLNLKLHALDAVAKRRAEHRQNGLHNFKLIIIIVLIYVELVRRQRQR